MRSAGLDVVVELELSWMWTQAHVINFSAALVIDPRLDEILREDAALGEECVIALEVIEHLRK